MAVKFVKGGLQSVDNSPFKKKKVEEQPVESTPTPSFPMEKPGQNNKIPGWRQELANARAEQAGVEPINLRTNMTATEMGIRKNIQDQTLANQIQQGQVSPEEQQRINAFMAANPSPTPQNLGGEGNGTFNAIAAGAGKVATGVGLGAAGAAIGGAVAGAPTGGAGIPVGALVGGAIGTGIGTFIQGFTGKLKSEEQEKIAVEYRTLPNSLKSMNQLIAYVNKGGTDREGAWKTFNEQLEAIDEAEGTLKRESDEFLNKFLDVDTTREMGYINSFNEQLRENYRVRMITAMMRPNPNLPEDDGSIADFMMNEGTA